MVDDYLTRDPFDIVEERYGAPTGKDSYIKRGVLGEAGAAIGRIPGNALVSVGGLIQGHAVTRAKSPLAGHGLIKPGTEGYFGETVANIGYNWNQKLRPSEDVQEHDWDSMRFWTNGLFDAAGQMAIQVGAGLTGLGAIGYIGAAGVQVFGGSFDRARRDGFSMDESLKYAAIESAVELGTEAAPGVARFTSFGNRASNALMRKALRWSDNAARTKAAADTFAFGIQAGKTVAVESGSEFWSGVLSSIHDDKAHGRPVDGVGSLMSGIEEAVMVGPAALATSGFHAPEYRKYQNSTHNLRAHVEKSLNVPDITGPDGEKMADSGEYVPVIHVTRKVGGMDDVIDVEVGGEDVHGTHLSDEQSYFLYEALTDESAKYEFGFIDGDSNFVPAEGVDINAEVERARKGLFPLHPKFRVATEADMISEEDAYMVQSAVESHAQGPQGMSLGTYMDTIEIHTRIAEQALEEFTNAKGAAKKWAKGEQWVPLMEAIEAWHGGRELQGGKFDLKFVRSGTGAMAEGHGIYLSGEEKAGDYYAELARQNVQVPANYVPELSADGEKVSAAGYYPESDPYTYLANYVVNLIGPTRAVDYVDEIVRDAKELRSVVLSYITTGVRGQAIISSITDLMEEGSDKVVENARDVALTFKMNLAQGEYKDVKRAEQLYVGIMKAKAGTAAAVDCKRILRSAKTNPFSQLRVEADRVLKLYEGLRKHNKIGLVGLESSKRYKYKVRLRKDSSEYTWLDWTKPVSQSILNRLPLTLREKFSGVPPEEYMDILDSVGIHIDEDILREGDPKEISLRILHGEIESIQDEQQSTNDPERYQVLEGWVKRYEEALDDVEILEEVKDKRYTGQQLYRAIDQMFQDGELSKPEGMWGDEATSKLLLECGIDGTRYPVARRDPKYYNPNLNNYVIYDPNEIQIQQKIVFEMAEEANRNPEHTPEGYQELADITGWTFDAVWEDGTPQFTDRQPGSPTEGDTVRIPITEPLYEYWEKEQQRLLEQRGVKEEQAEKDNRRTFEEGETPQSNRYQGKKGEFRGFAVPGPTSVKRMIVLVKERADVATFLHEFGHIFFSELTEAEQRSAKRLFSEASRNKGRKKRGEIEEDIANGFLDWIATGHSPSEAHEALFKRMGRSLRTLQNYHFSNLGEVKGPINKFFTQWFVRDVEDGLRKIQLSRFEGKKKYFLNTVDDEFKHLKPGFRRELKGLMNKIGPSTSLRVVANTLESMQRKAAARHEHEWIEGDDPAEHLHRVTTKLRENAEYDVMTFNEDGEMVKTGKKRAQRLGSADADIIAEVTLMIGALHAYSAETSERYNQMVKTMAAELGTGEKFGSYQNRQDSKGLGSLFAHHANRILFGKASGILTILKKLGVSEDSVTYNVLYRALTEGDDSWHSLRGMAQHAFDDLGITQETIRDQRTDSREYVFEGGRREAGDHVEMNPKISMTTAQALGLALTLMDPRNVKEAAKNGAVLQDSVNKDRLYLNEDALNSFLGEFTATKLHRDLIQAALKTFATFRPAYIEAKARTTGVLEDIDPNENYVPRWRYVGTKSEEQALNPIKMNTLEMISHVHERSDQAANPLYVRDFYDIYQEYAETMSAYIGKHRASADALTMLNNETVANHFDAHFGNDPTVRFQLMKILRTWRGIEQPTSGEPLVRRMLRGVHVFNLGGNVPVFMAQAVSLLNAIAADHGLSLSDIRQALHNARGKSGEINKEIQNFCPFLWNRAEGANHGVVTSGLQDTSSAAFATPNDRGTTQDLTEGIKEKNVGEVVRSTASLSMRPIHLVDMWVVRRIWEGAKLRVARENPELEFGSDEFMGQVAQTASDIVRESQPTWDPVSSTGWITEASQNPWKKLFFMYQSQRTKNVDMMIRGIVDYMHSERTLGDKQKLASRIMIPILVNSALITAIKMGYRGTLTGISLMGKGDGGGDDREIVRDYIFDTTTAVFGNFPFVSILTDSAIKGIKYDNPAFAKMYSSETPIASFVDYFGSFMHNTVSGLGEDDFNEVQAMSDVTKMASMAFGLPLNSLMRDVKTLTKEEKK